MYLKHLFKTSLLIAMFIISIAQSTYTMDPNTTISLASKLAQYCKEKAQQCSEQLVKLKELKDNHTNSTLHSFFPTFNMDHFYAQEIERFTKFQHNINIELTQEIKSINTLFNLIKDVIQLIQGNASEILKLNNVDLTENEATLLQMLTNNSNEN